jgi:thymidylate kinase
MITPVDKSRTWWVSFSGIDGAGKSTQIEVLRAAAELCGLSVRVIRFWDDVSRLKAVREMSGHKIFKGDRGIGSPEKPINRRDKNVRSWTMTCVRLFLYSIDAISTRQTVAKALGSGWDFVIFDRYIYDELANLNLGNPLMRGFVHLLMNFAPRPDISFILDADPTAARARKPEYPLDFLYENREAYLKLSRMIGGMTVIPPGDAAAVKREVLRRALDLLSARAEGRGCNSADQISDQTSRIYSTQPAQLD